MNGAAAIDAHSPRRATELMTGPDGVVPATLMGVHDTIVGSATPRKALNWLRQGAGAPILAELARGTIALSHDTLDDHPRPMAANHVRQMLVAHGVLAVERVRIAENARCEVHTAAGLVGRSQGI